MLNFVLGPHLNIISFFFFGEPKHPLLEEQ